MPDESVRYEPYGRFWAVYENDTLLCLVVYRKGAKALLTRLIEGAPQIKEKSTSKPEPLPTSRNQNP
jgi:hypothetical protein